MLAWTGAYAVEGWLVNAVRTNFRSTIFQRLFWCAFLSVLVVVEAAELTFFGGRGSFWTRSIVLSFVGGLGAFLLALVMSQAIDRRIARMREFAEGLLEGGDEPSASGALDQLGALDRSLLRMASQTR